MGGINSRLVTNCCITVNTDSIQVVSLGKGETPPLGCLLEQMAVITEQIHHYLVVNYETLVAAGPQTSFYWP